MSATTLLQTNHKKTHPEEEGIYNNMDSQKNNNLAASANSNNNSNNINDDQFTEEELRRAKSSIITLAIGGLLTGYVIGVVGVLLSFYQSAMSVPCTAAESESVCAWLSGPSSACMWMAHRSACVTNGVGQLCLTNGNINASVCGNLTQVWDPYTSKTQNVSCYWSSSPTYTNTMAGDALCLDNAPAQKASIWSSSENGAIAAMLIAGGFISSFFARRYVGTPQQTVRALQAVGFISIVACVFHISSWFVADYGGRLALVLIARFVAGIVLGSVSIFCTLFNALNSPPQLVSSIGVYFQVFTTLGIFLAALAGFVVRYSTSKNSNKMAASVFFADGNSAVSTSTIQLFQVPYALNFLISFGLIVLPFLVTVKGTHLDYFDGDGADSRSSFAGEKNSRDKTANRDGENVDDDNNNNDDKRVQRKQEKAPLTSNAAVQVVTNNNNNTNTSVYDDDNGIDREKSSSSPQQGAPGPASATTVPPSTWQSWKDFLSRPHLVLAGTLLAAIQQFSGINAVMFFSGNIASAQGVTDTFLSNLLIMLWNFLTALVAIPVARWAKRKYGYESADIYTPGAFFTAISCFIIGIPSFPGVASDGVRAGFSIFGLAFFLFSFEVGMGPHFYTMTQSMFSDSVKKTGCVYTNTVHFIFTAMVSFGFPIVIQGFGGGGDNQTDEQKEKGIASAFIMFGCIDLVSVAVLKMLMPKLLAEKKQD